MSEIARPELVWITVVPQKGGCLAWPLRLPFSFRHGWLLAVLVDRTGRYWTGGWSSPDEAAGSVSNCGNKDRLGERKEGTCRT